VHGRRPLGTFAAIATVLIATHALGKVEEKFDRFDQRTSVILTVGLGPRVDSAKIQLVAIGGYEGSKAPQDNQSPVLLGLRFTNKTWEYLRCHHVAWLVDGWPIPTPDFEHNGSVGEGYVIETVRGHVEPEVARALANAKTSIEFKICNDEFKVGKSGIDEFRSFMTRLGYSLSAQDEATTSKLPEPVAPHAPKEESMPSIEALTSALDILTCNLREVSRGSGRETTLQVCGGVMEGDRILRRPPSDAPRPKDAARKSPP